VLANEAVLSTTLVNMFKGVKNNFVAIVCLRSKATIKLYNILGTEVRIKALPSYDKMFLIKT
jgi:hypothetical protein|tara:strand:+ start:690 stop:875 length:186 start_codon:yes stop_codon:yes gene_type:complete